MNKEKKCRRHPNKNEFVWAPNNKCAPICSVAAQEKKKRRKEEKKKRRKEEKNR